MPITRTWAHGKARAFSDAWERVFGATPAFHTVVLGLAVATHETRAGDAWPDEHNWGATTLRALNPTERQALIDEATRLLTAAGLNTRPGHSVVLVNFRWHWRAPNGALFGFLPNEKEAVKSVTPTVGKGHEARADRAEEVIRAHLRKIGQHAPQASIHCDSAPAFGPYFVWFASFKDDTDGAEYFVKLLAGKPDKLKRAHAVLVSGGSEQALAKAMYDAGYYTGFHDPKKPGGAQKNIDAYAASLRRIAPALRAALTTGPIPSAPITIRRGMTGEDVERWQRILVHDGAVITVDGKFGLVTEAITKAWQHAHGLAADGVVGPKTWAAAGVS